MYTSSITDLLADQAGVLSRSQVLQAHGTPSDIARLLRRREWVRVLPGVYLNHTGEPTWLQRAWAGVLFHWPAALAGMSAIRACVGPGWQRHDDAAPIELAVPQRRHTVPRAGDVLHRPTDFADRVQWSAAPPRIRLEQAGVDVAARQPDTFAMVGLLADLCRTRRTTPERLLRTIAARGRISHRATLTGILTDIDEGTCSVLEHGFLHLVEIPHGLPHPSRQRPHRSIGGLSLRDVEYDGLGLIVELDGRLFHDTARQRDADLERDLVAAVDAEVTVRLGWGQVFDRSCRTAGHLGRIMRSRGWTGRPTPCGSGCGLAATGAYDAPGAPYTPVTKRRAG